MLLNLSASVCGRFKHPLAADSSSLQHTSVAGGCGGGGVVGTFKTLGRRVVLVFSREFGPTKITSLDVWGNILTRRPICAHNFCLSLGELLYLPVLGRIH